MFFKGKKQLSLNQSPEEKLYSQYGVLFSAIKPAMDTLLEAKSRLEAHEKVCEKDLEEIKPEFLSCLAESEAILQNPHYRLLAQGVPEHSLETLDDRKPYTVLKTIELKSLNSLLVKSFEYQIGLEGWYSPALASVDLSNELEHCFGCTSVKAHSVHVVATEVVGLYSSTVLIKFVLEVKLINQKEKDEIQRKLAAIKILFEGENGLNHLMAVKDELFELNGRITALRDNLYELLALYNSEESYNEDLERLDDLDPDVKAAQNAFFGSKQF